MSRRLLLCFFVLMAVWITMAATVAADAVPPVSCPQCEVEVTWTGLSTVEDDAAIIPAGHYIYDYAEDSHRWTAEKSVSGAVCICIPEGKTLTAAERVFSVASGGKLSLCGSGTVKAGDFASTAATGDRIGGAVWVKSGGTLNLREVTLTDEKPVEGKTGSSNGGVVGIYGTCNMYSGTVKDGTATTGGNIYVYHKGAFNMFGGTISGGTAGTGNCVYARGNVKLSGDATIEKLQFVTNVAGGGPAYAEALTIQGRYTGTVTLQFGSMSMDLEAYPDLGNSDNANIRSAMIMIANTDYKEYYLVTSGTDLKLSEVPAGHVYCAYCDRVVDTWTALTDEDAADTALEGGHYYLDCSDPAVAWAKKTVAAGTTVCLDLNNCTVQGQKRLFYVAGTLNVMGNGTLNGGGFNSTAETGAADRAGGVFKVVSNGALNIYGGTYGVVKQSGNDKAPYNGGIIGNTGSGPVCVYGGTLHCASVDGVGGAIFIGPYGSVELSGGKISGESPSVCVQGEVTLTGAPEVSRIQLWKATGSPAHGKQLIFKDTFSGTVTIQFHKNVGADLSNGAVIGISDNANLYRGSVTIPNTDLRVIPVGENLTLSADSGDTMIFNGDTYVGSYADLNAALEAYTGAPQRIVLIGDASSVEATKDAYVDLNGCDIGTVTGTGTLYCMDSQTDDYDVTDGSYGTVPACEQVKGLPQGSGVAGDGYLMVAGENGTVSFHRLTLRAKSISLRPESVGLYITCSFAGDELVKAQVKDFGVALEVEGDPADDTGLTRWVSYGKENFGADATAHSVLIYNILNNSLSEDVNNQRAAMQVNGRAYLQTEGGELIYGALRGRSLRQVLEGVYVGDELELPGVDAMLTTLTYSQRFALMQMYEQYKQILDTWNIPNIKTAEPLEPSQDDTLRIMMVGNSFCYYYVEELYAMLMENRPAGVEKVEVYNLYVSGCTLTAHLHWWKNGEANYQLFKTDSNGRNKLGDKWSLEDALSQGNWDYISLHGSKAGGNYLIDDTDVLKTEIAELAEPLLDRFHERFPKAQLLWQRTWFPEIGRITSDGYAYTEEDGPKYNTAMQRVCDYMCNEFDKDKAYDLVMVNSGTAWIKARELNETADVLPYGGLCARLGKNSFGDGRANSGDGYHEGDIGGGQLLNAYVWYMTITGDRDLSDSTYMPVYKYSGKEYPLSEAHIDMLREAAESVFAQ